MKLEYKKIGFVMTGSFCTFRKTIDELKKIVELGAKVVPIMSEHSYTMDTKFGKAEDFKKEIEEITENKILHTIQEVEPIGPKDMLDILVVAPATGNTMAKLANGITDTPVLMAAKAHLRSNRPLILALASNDALSANLKNIGTLISRKSVYFVPMEQDEPIEKPHSLIADFDLLPQTLTRALEGKQYQRVFK